MLLTFVSSTVLLGGMHGATARQWHKSITVSNSYSSQTRQLQTKTEDWDGSVKSCVQRLQLEKNLAMCSTQFGRKVQRKIPNCRLYRNDCRFEVKFCVQIGLRESGEQFISVLIDGGWWKAEILPYKHAIASYGAAIAGLPSQIAYGGWQSTTTPFRHGGAIAAM
ncbi:hypothetical protein D0Y65_034814 [Glycine soja]|uniref:Uncharacterized protein n=1 Tax=Glycine soja TaxID=3848 RepID=A0A445HS52_GLYSO|nr:hypothetical protein D0Y65_034814 [Glycine soja]